MISARMCCRKLKETHRLFAYDFATNKVPGFKSYEEVGLLARCRHLDAYFEAHQDLLGLTPRFDVFNPQWRIFSSNYQGPVARILISHNVITA
jgi:glucose-1-phosphate adenylyltransferase